MSLLNLSGYDLTFFFLLFLFIEGIHKRSCKVEELKKEIELYEKILEGLGLSNKKKEKEKS